MALKWTAVLARATYAALFVVALPALLVVWARVLDNRLDLPACRAENAGSLLAAAGLLIWTAGILQIVRQGGGLPMNAFRRRDWRRAASTGSSPIRSTWDGCWPAPGWRSPLARRAPCSS